MTLYEIVKDLLLPDISKWESHLITIAVTVILVTCLTYIIIQKQNRLLYQVYLTEQKADTASKHLASIVESSDDAILSINSDGNIISWNSGAERIFEVSAADIQNRPLSTLMPPEIPNKIAEFLGLVGRGESVRHLETVFTKTNGDRIHLSLTANPLPDMEGQSGNVSIIARDISVQIAREEMLKMLTVKQQLFSAITRHDINNCLHILLGYCSILEERTSDPEISNIVRIIQEQSVIIKDQIEFMKNYESLGRHVPTWHRAEDVFSKAIIPFKNKPVKFQVSLDPLEVYVDPLIEKVIYNLCDNALKYGEKLSSIQTFYTQDGDNCIWIIEDDGIGIETECKEKIFQKGFGKTTGLGLFFIKEILSITNIQIRETGKTNEGARFELIIPVGFWRFKNPEKYDQ